MSKQWKVLAAATSLGLGVVFQPAAAIGGPATARDLTVVSWGGLLARSQMRAFINPFRKESEVWVELDRYDGGLDEIRAQVLAENVLWDVVDMSPVDVERGCAEGLLETIDPSSLPAGADGTPVADDFAPDALVECGVGQYIWATAVLYDRADFAAAAAPTTIADFFDVARFPGKRGMRRDPRVNLEWALIADGVPAADVYDVLDTPAGLDRAFASLDRIKSSIVWWTDGEEPISFLDQDRVSMSTVWNGRTFRPIVEEEKDYGLIWDHQVWELEYWAIVRGTPHLEAALDYLRFVTQTERQAAQAEHITYGPARRSALNLVSEAMRPLLPTTEDNMATALRADTMWWAEHFDEVAEEFEDWIRRGGSALAGVAR